MNPLQQGSFPPGAAAPLLRGVIIRLDCYDTPDEPMRGSVRRFAAHVDGDAPKLQGELKAKGFVASLGLEYHWRMLGN
jgi:hypothetical protein